MSQWPGVTALLYQFGTALYHGLWINILIGIAALVFGIRTVMFNVSGDIRNRYLDRIIPFNIYKKLVSSIFLNTLAMMLKNRIPLQESIVIIEQNGNRWFKSHLKKCWNEWRMASIIVNPSILAY